MSIAKGYANLGKPVTMERIMNARHHMHAMYPDWPEKKRNEIVKAAAKLIEKDDPDAIWGHVNALPPLDEMQWVDRMRLGAALLAEA